MVPEKNYLFLAQYFIIYKRVMFLGLKDNSPWKQEMTIMK